MKKLMFAAAALAAGFAMAEGEITSANIVGYQTKTTVAGFNFVTPTFKNVSGTTIDLQSIKLTGENAFEYVDQVMVLDEGGVPVGTYTWVGGCWTDDDYVPVTVSLALGESVLINTMNSDVEIQFSGEVGRDDLQLISVAGFNFVGNASPVAIDIQAITLTGENAFEYVDQIMILDEGGVPVQTYTWVNGGWTNDDYEPVTVNLNSGDGVLINTMNAGVEINLPAVELE